MSAGSAINQVEGQQSSSLKARIGNQTGIGVVNGLAITVLPKVFPALAADPEMLAYIAIAIQWFGTNLTKVLRNVGDEQGWAKYFS